MITLTKEEKQQLIKFKIKEIHAIISDLIKNGANQSEIDEQNARILFFENMIKEMVD